MFNVPPCQNLKPRAVLLTENRIRDEGVDTSKSVMKFRTNAGPLFGDYIAGLKLDTCSLLVEISGISLALFAIPCILLLLAKAACLAPQKVSQVIGTLQALLSF